MADRDLTSALSKRKHRPPIGGGPIKEKAMNENTTAPYRPKVKLLGTDGNAFAVMGACKKAARAAGWTPAQITALTGDMMAGDYNHLLGVAMQRFDVE